VCILTARLRVTVGLWRGEGVVTMVIDRRLVGWSESSVFDSYVPFRFVVVVQEKGPDSLILAAQYLHNECSCMKCNEGQLHTK
jgi:hypothetical protein